VSKLTQDDIIKLSAALTVAIGIAAAGAVLTRDEPTPTKVEPVADGGAPTDAAPPIDADPFYVDPAKYHEVIVAAFADAGLDRDHTADILSRPVAAGETIDEYVTRPKGTRPTGDFDLIGEAVGRFTILDVSYADTNDRPTRGDVIVGETVIRIRARNDSFSAVRLTGLVHYTPPGP